MTKRTRTILIMILLPIMLISLSVCLTYAFFLDERAAEGTPEIGTHADGEVFVGTQAEFIKYTTDGDFNLRAEQSSISANNRRTVKLASDVTLTSDLVITADCHVDLNGKTLTLNGHSLTITHSYVGSFVFCNTSANGGVKLTDEAQSDATEESAAETAASKNREKIFYDLSRSKAIFDFNFLYKNGAGANLTVPCGDMTGVTFDVSDDPLFVSYASLRNVALMISETVLGIERMTDYASVGATLIDGVYVFPSTAFGNATEYYLTQDVALPSGYNMRDDYSIEYVSSVPEVLDEKGNVTPRSSRTDLTLTARVTRVDEDGERETVAQCEFPISVVSPIDSGALSDGAFAMLDEYVGRYAVGLTEGGDVLYGINSEILLPRTLLGVDIEYYAYDGSSLQSEAIFVPAYDSPKDYGIVLGDNVDVYVFAPTSQTVRLVAETDTDTKTYYVSSSFSGTVHESSYTVASDFISERYGSMITVSDSSAGNSLNGFTTQQLFTDVSDYASKGLKGVSYSLVNDAEGVYAFTDKGMASPTYDDEGYYMYIASGKDPSLLVQTVLLNAMLTFEGDTTGAEDDETISIQLAIGFVSSETGETNVHGFLPYYGYFKQMLGNVTGGYTIESFKLPFCFGAGDPTVYFGIEGDTSQAITMTLCYGDVQVPISDTDELNAYLVESGMTLKQIAASNPYWLFDVDLSRIPAENTEITVKYYYILTLASISGEPNWTLYSADDEEPDSDHVSEFVLAGIIRNDETGIPDSSFYAWTYNNFTPITDDTYSEGKVIYSDWLSKSVTFDFAASGLPVGTSYKGAQYLGGITSADFSSSGITAGDVADYVSQMSGLRTLKLGGNSLTNDGGWLEALANNSEVTVLYVNDNEIADFTHLESFAFLRSVYLYGNVEYGVSSIFNGSKGLGNLPIYDVLYGRGVSVYNYTSDGVPQLFKTSTLANDYVNLSSVEYQRKLPEGQDVRKLYETLSSVAADYGLSPSYSYYATQGAETPTTSNVSNVSLIWGYVGSDGTQYADAAAAVLARNGFTSADEDADGDGDGIPDEAETSEAIFLAYNFTLSGTNVEIVIQFTVNRMNGGIE